MDSGIGKNIDRLSSLPDCLLGHILSFLPTKYAVGTSILAKRWGDVWMYLPKFDFDECTVFGNNDSDKIDESFACFVSRVLCLSRAPCFQTISLNVASYEAFKLLGEWISLAILRGVQRLDLCNLNDLNLVLPNKFFNSTTLVVMILYGVFFDVRDDAWLPNLKIAVLEVENDSEDSLENFLGGCPVIEDLSIKRKDFEERQRLVVCSPTLKRLRIECYGHELDLYEYQDQWCELLVNAPSLEQLDFSDYYLDNICFENLSSLAKAYVHVGRISRTTDIISAYEGLPIYKLLSGISNVKILDASFFYHDDFSGYTLPAFGNLAKLSLGSDEFSDWNVKLVTDFLECSPNLEVLVVEGSRHNSWKPPQKVPKCLLLSLKEVRIEDFIGEDYELLMIEYLLKNAKVLEMMKVDCRNADDGSRAALAAFPRGSEFCQLTLV